MDISEVRSALLNAVLYIDERGEGIDLGVVAAQLELARLRLKVVQQDSKKVLQMVKKG